MAATPNNTYGHDVEKTSLQAESPVSVQPSSPSHKATHDQAEPETGAAAWRSRRSVVIASRVAAWRSSYQQWIAASASPPRNDNRFPVTKGDDVMLLPDQPRGGPF
jgi:hypothetical protein